MNNYEEMIDDLQVTNEMNVLNYIIESLNIDNNIILNESTENIKEFFRNIKKFIIKIVKSVREFIKKINLKKKVQDEILDDIEDNIENTENQNDDIDLFEVNTQFYDKVGKVGRAKINIIRGFQKRDVPQIIIVDKDKCNSCIKQMKDDVSNIRSVLPYFKMMVNIFIHSGKDCSDSYEKILSHIKDKKSDEIEINTIFEIKDIKNIDKQIIIEILKSRHFIDNIGVEANKLFDEFKKQYDTFYDYIDDILEAKTDINKNISELERSTKIFFNNLNTDINLIMSLIKHLIEYKGLIIQYGRYYLRNKK